MFVEGFSVANVNLQLQNLCFTYIKGNVNYDMAMNLAPLH